MYRRWIETIAEIRACYMAAVLQMLAPVWVSIGGLRLGGRGANPQRCTLIGSFGAKHVLSGGRFSLMGASLFGWSWWLFARK